MKTATVFTAAVLTIFSISFLSCSKNEKSSSNAHLKVYLTDAPAAFDQVVIDVRDVQINVTNDSAGGWQSLPGVAAASYNLLDLVNDNDTLLADADIPSGTIQQMRLILGSNNYVVLNGQNIPLETPSAQQSGLKLNIHQPVAEGVLYTMILDFDAARSIVKTGNNRYILKPVIRTMLNAVGGSIKGFVTPNSFSTTVFAIKGTDTASTFTDANGGYLIRGLSAGSYILNFMPGDTTYNAETRNGINVTVGNITAVDTVHLHR
jgi:hypothetical protein